MDSTNYQKKDGLALAELLYKREVAPVELMRTAIELAESRDGALNALCYRRYDQALEAAASAELKGQFGALPFLLKDSGLASTALPSSVGSRLFADSTFGTESTLNARFLADGMLPFARTTVPEFCMAPTTEAAQNGGPTLNPWDNARSAGGSSGGAGVAVARRIVPIAHGSDGGGSIRIPASCCGVYGLKTSRGLVPAGPARGEAWGGLAVDGVLTRTVRDSAAALDGIAGMELGAPYAAPPQPESYLAELDRPFSRKLRIAKWSTAFEDIPVAPECLAAVQQAAALLESLGHEVIDAPLPPIAFSKFVKAQIDLMAASLTMTINGKVRQLPDNAWERKLEPAILDGYRMGQKISAESYALAITRFHTIGRQMEVYLTDYDFILSPTLTQLPLQLGALSTEDSFRDFRTRASRYTTFVALFNASGQPAASVPLYWTDEGLPVGVQIGGKFGDEAGILRLSAQLEAVSPWIDRYR